MTDESDSKARKKSTETTGERIGVVLRSRDMRATPSLGEIGLNQFAPYLLNRVVGYWNARIQEGMRDHDLTVIKMRALAVLSIMPGLSINELAVFTVAEQSTMSRTLDAMEDQGLIRRRQQKDDGRVREVELTNQGRDLFSRYWPSLYAEFTAMFQNVSEEEFRVFTQVLHKLVRNQNERPL